MKLKLENADKSILEIFMGKMLIMSDKNWDSAIQQKNI